MIPRRIWAGGYNYQSNLFAALNRYRQGEITPVVFAGEQDDAADLRLLRASPASRSRDPQLSTDVVPASLQLFRSGSTMRRQLNFGDRRSTLFSNRRVFLVGVCHTRRWPGFRTFSINDCRNFFRQPRDGDASLGFRAQDRIGPHLSCSAVKARFATAKSFIREQRIEPLW